MTTRRKQQKDRQKYNIGDFYNDDSDEFDQDHFSDFDDDSGQGEESLSTLLTQEELLYAILSRVVAKERDLFQLSLFLNRLDENKLIKLFRRAVDSPDETLRGIRKFKSYGDEEVTHVVQTGFLAQQLNPFKGQQTKAWTKGGNIDWIGDTKELIKEYSVQQNIEDSSLLVKSAVREKEKMIYTVLKSMKRCFPGQQSRGLDTLSEHISFFKQQVEKFENGSRFGEINPRKFRYPTEPGILLPHTLTPKGWLEEVVTGFLRNQYGYVLVAFCDGSLTDVRKFDEDVATMHVNQEKDHPLNIENTPVFTEDMDEDGIWWFRNAQKEVKKGVVSTGKDYESLTETEKLRHLKQYTKVHSKEMRIKLKPAAAVMKVDGKVHIAFKVFKRGYSKIEEVSENPNFIHIVSSNSAPQLRADEWKLFTLPDCYSVIAIPDILWNQSNPAQTGNKVEGYFGKPGYKPINKNVYGLWIALYHLSYTFSYLEYLENNVEFPSPKSHWRKIREKLVAGKHAVVIGSRTSKSAASHLCNRVTQGTINSLGIYIEPFPSKIGRQTQDKRSMYEGLESADDDEEDIFSAKPGGVRSSASTKGPSIVFEPEYINEFDIESSASGDSQENEEPEFNFNSTESEDSSSTKHSSNDVDEEGSDEVPTENSMV